MAVGPAFTVSRCASSTAAVPQQAGASLSDRVAHRLAVDGELPPRHRAHLDRRGFEVAGRAIGLSGKARRGIILGPFPAFGIASEETDAGRARDQRAAAIGEAIGRDGRGAALPPLVEQRLPLRRTRIAPPPPPPPFLN